MRIIQLVQKPQRRGAEIFAYQLSEALIEHGHQVKTIYLYSPPKSNPLPLRDEDSILNRNENHLAEKIPGWNPSIVKYLAAAVHQFQPDVIQLNGARSVKYGALLRFFMPNCPWVIVYRNIGDPRVWLKRRWLRWFYRHILMPKIDGMVAVSLLSLSVLRAIYPGRNNMIRIPRAVNHRTFVPKRSRNEVRNQLSTKEDDSVLIFVGSLTPEKRVDKLLLLFQQAIQRVPYLYLWILGDGPLRHQLERDADRIAVSAASHIRFLGLQEDVASFVNAADLLILFSETEGIPGVILEAAALGLPCVASNVGGVPECVVDGETGILVDPENDFAFVTSVLDLILDPKKRIEMGKRAENWTKKNFSMENVAINYLQFYQHLIQVRSQTLNGLV